MTLPITSSSAPQPVAKSGWLAEAIGENGGCRPELNYFTIAKMDKLGNYIGVARQLNGITKGPRVGILYATVQGRTAHITKTEVNPSCLRRGIFRAMLTDLDLTMFQGGKVRWIQVETHIQNKVAIEAYKAVGFKETLRNSAFVTFRRPVQGPQLTVPLP
jgi:ribosomal protein S18 acetylase RimI-like enzyme